MHRPKNLRVRVHLVLPALAALPLLLSTSSPPLDALPATEQLPSPATHRGADRPVTHRNVTTTVAAKPVTVTSPKGERTVAAGGVGPTDIPLTAMDAYQRAATVLAQVDPACHLPWTLLAGIGRVESDHGRYAGAVLGADGTSRPDIVGVPLDGTGRVAKIADTDNGKYDHDKVWDRAVGPMQFLPSTWVGVGVDGDADGIRSPDDINDAALAAAVYLCAGNSNLQVPKNMRSALRRYNDSGPYATLVMSYEQRYRTGNFTVPGPVAAASAVAWRKVGTDGQPALPRKSSATKEQTRAGAVLARAAHNKTGHQTSTPSWSVDPAGKHDAKAGTPNGPASPAASPPADSPSAVTTTVSSPGHGPSPTPTPTTKPPAATTPTGAPGPTEAPTPTTAPCPAPTPAPSQAPSQAPSSAPDQPITRTGVWGVCDTGFTLDGSLLALGDADALKEPAAADFDGDGQVESNGEELAGLVGTEVTLTATASPSGWLVHSINGTDYPVTATNP